MDSKVLAFQERAGKDGGGKGILITENKTNCLATSALPIVCYPIEGNGSRPSHQGMGVAENGAAMFTLNSTEVHAVAYSIMSLNSNGMKSDNPNVGFKETNIARTLDENGGDPTCNQGGVLIVEGVPVLSANESITWTEEKSVCIVNGTCPGFYEERICKEDGIGINSADSDNATRRGR